MTTDPHKLAASLDEQRKRDLTLHWDEFSDADPLSHGRELDAFLQELETDGFIQCVPVDDDALQSSFAYERGIEPGGMMWELTPLGLAVRAVLIEEVGR